METGEARSLMEIGQNGALMETREFESLMKTGGNKSVMGPDQ